MKILLVNPFDKIPGEQFRDQRYTVLYNKLRVNHQVLWISSDYHHWTHTVRKTENIPYNDKPNLILIPVIKYKRNIGITRLLSHLMFSLRAIGKLKEIGFKPDLIICVAPVEAMYLFTSYARKRSVRIVLDVLDLWPDLFIKPFPYLTKWLGRILFGPYFWMSQRAFRYADHITSVSQSYTKWAMRRGGRNDDENSSFYYLGGMSAGRQYNLAKSRERLTCLFAGQLGFNYDVATVIRASRILRERNIDVEIVIAGDGYKRSSLVKEAEGLPSVRFTGWLEYDELMKLSIDCHVGLNCYIGDATQSVPTKLFDYLSMGLLVVNSLEGETAELLETTGTGLSYQSGDAEGLAKLLAGFSCQLDEVILKGRTSAELFDRHFRVDAIYNRMISEIIEKEHNGN